MTTRKLTSVERAIMKIVRHHDSYLDRPARVRVIQGQIRQMSVAWYKKYTRERDIRDLIKSIQDKGAPLYTTGKGVRIAKSAADIQEQATRMRRHAYGELARARHLERNLRLTDRLRGQRTAYHRLERNRS